MDQATTESHAAKINHLTWKIPGFIFVYINLLNELNGQRPLLNLSLEVKPNKLLIGRMESKTRHHHIIKLVNIILLFHSSLNSF